MISHLLVFLYIASFCLGIVTYCLVAMNRRVVSGLYGIEEKDLRRFLMVLFIFFLVNFLIYYSEIIIDSRVNILLLHAFDALLILTIYTGAKMNHIDSVDKMNRVLLVIGAVYLVIWGITYYMPFMENPNVVLGSIVRMLTDTILSSVAVGYMIVLSTFQWQKNKDKGEARYLISINVILMFYALGLYAEDLYFELIRAYYPESVNYPYSLDPVFLLFIAVNLFTLLYIKSGLSKVGLSAFAGGQGEEQHLKEVLSNYNISPREQEVIMLILEGKSNSEIAEEFSISIYTVKRHINNIFRKMDIGSRAELLEKTKQRQEP